MGEPLCRRDHSVRKSWSHRIKNVSTPSSPHSLSPWGPPSISWVSHCFLLWVPGNTYPLGISSSTGNTLETQVYLSIHPLSLIEQCLGVGHRPQALPFQRWYQSHSRPPPNRSVLQAATVRLGVRRQGTYGEFEAGKPETGIELHHWQTYITSQLSFNIYDTLRKLVIVFEPQY